MEGKKPAKNGLKEKGGQKDGGTAHRHEAPRRKPQAMKDKLARLQPVDNQTVYKRPSFSLQKTAF